MFNLFKRKQEQIPNRDEVAQVLVQVFNRFKAQNPRAKMRVPAYMRMFLIRKGIKPLDMVEDANSLIDEPKRVKGSTYILKGDRLN